MAVKAIFGLSLLVLQVTAHDPLQRRRAHSSHANHARQLSPSPSSVFGSGSTGYTYNIGSSVSAAAPTVSIPGLRSTLTATDPSIPPLASIVSGMPSQATPLFSQTFSPGAMPPISGAPPLPTAPLDRSKYPSPTELAPTDGPYMEEWLKELEGHEIPDIPPTTNNAQCSSNKEAAADPTRCWWTCGGCTRSTDIYHCPTQQDWGLSFDDGPSPYTPKLLEYLGKQDLHATLFVVGSAVYYNADILKAAHMAGHQIGVHTWRHLYMTTLTTKQVVAELGQSRQIIQEVTGVTPKFWRPPYGDVDDRVRAIAAAMNMATVIWTRDPVTNEQYDTNDWKIPAGLIGGSQALMQFQTILSNATMLGTGFIVLEHDLYEQTVDLAVGYTLPEATSHVPYFNLKSINECLGNNIEEAYMETATNKTTPTPSTNWTGYFFNGIDDGSVSNSSASGGSLSNGGSGGEAKKGGSGGGAKKGSGAVRVTFGAGALLGGILASYMVYLA